MTTVTLNEIRTDLPTMPVIDQEDHPHTTRPAGPVDWVEFDFAAVDMALSGRTAPEPERLEILEGFFRWLFEAESIQCRPSTLARRIGLQIVAAAWVTHPDRMPWARGTPLSAGEVAKAIKIPRASFLRAVASASRELGVGGPPKAHAGHEDSRHARRAHTALRGRG